jgi:hypothetical protein
LRTYEKLGNKERKGEEKGRGKRYTNKARQNLVWSGYVVSPNFHPCTMSNLSCTRILEKQINSLCEVEKNLLLLYAEIQITLEILQRKVRAAGE